MAYNLGEIEISKPRKTEIAIFGMGCFWGPQKLFDKTPGVIETEVGFMGGSGEFEDEEVSYEAVCSGETGHAEVVKVEFNPNAISYSELLDLFWGNHDATQKDRQGVDIGNQYRSVIFYTKEEQKRIAENSKKEVQKMIGNERKIETEIISAGKFYKAEGYHQGYLEKNPGRVCHFGSTFR